MISAILRILAGLVDLFRSFIAEYDKEQNIEQGRLEEQSKEQAAKDSDEAIAQQVDNQPVPTDKSRILGGMSESAD